MTEYLYKYRALDDYSEDMFKESKLWFANKTQFNDPFDCRFSIQIDGTSEERRKHFRRIHAERHPGLPAEQRRKNVAIFMKKLAKNPKSYEEDSRRSLDSDVEKLGIYSLSEKPDEILMWSHYADCHKGFCLQFRHASDCRFMARAQPVIYSDDYPIIKTVTDPHQVQVEKAILTKSSSWSYEKEWRIIDHQNGFGIRRFPDHALSGVIFGCKMLEENRQRIRDWCNGREVSFYEAKLSESKFGVDIIAA